MELTELQIFRRIVVKLLKAILWRVRNTPSWDEDELKILQETEDYLKVD